jgi:hypothetical protein
MELARQSSKNPSVNASDALDVAIELLEDVQKMVGVGKPKSLRIRFGDKTIARFPLAVTAAAAFAAGLAAVLLTKLVVDIEHEAEE